MSSEDMDTTFITIHDLSPNATILYCSDSIVDILGHSPSDVLQTSSWNYFHPDEVPLARAKHGRSVELDKAAVLSYCRLKHKDGSWLGCEVVFTVVYDVLVGCISIYKRGVTSECRAAEAPIVRRIFSKSPHDPRYHMLSHLSPKFSMPAKAESHENRAALFLNRYTRTLTIMYATDGLSQSLGMTGEELRGHSFYYCIQESCLSDAIKCLEHAKGNNSIAYLRFWFRDPRQEADTERSRMDFDSDPSTNFYSTSYESARSQNELGRYSSVESQAISSTDDVDLMDTADSGTSRGATRESSGDQIDGIFDETPERSSSASSVTQSPLAEPPSYESQPSGLSRSGAVELEAVISCTSDGLVVCLRVARPQTLQLSGTNESAPSNGLFAAPWSHQPMLPPLQGGPQFMEAQPYAPSLDSTRAQQRHTSGPEAATDDFMDAIRDCAIFAWANAGINGALADYSVGTPRDKAQPESGLFVWHAEAEPSHGNQTHVPRASGFNTAVTNGNNGVTIPQERFTERPH